MNLLCTRIVSCVRVTVDGVWVGKGFTEHLYAVTTSRYSSIASSHTLQFTDARAVFSVCTVCFASGLTSYRLEIVSLLTS
jgi:hypothetical protein